MTSTRRSELNRILAIDEDGYSGLRESLLRWADRWAGRPSREQIAKLLKENVMIAHNECIQNSFVCCDLMEGILRLYPAPASERNRVSRMDIACIVRRIDGGLRSPLSDSILEDLCTLLGVEEEKPVEATKCECYPNYRPGMVIPVIAFNPPTCASCRLEIPRPVEKGRGEG